MPEVADPAVDPAVAPAGAGEALAVASHSPTWRPDECEGSCICGVKALNGLATPPKRLDPTVPTWMAPPTEPMASEVYVSI